MSLNISTACCRFVTCTTDRRLTLPRTGRVTTERSTKLTKLVCANAVFYVTYNGIGDYHGATPSDWLQELASQTNLGQMTFGEVVNRTRDIVDQRIGVMRDVPNPRHTFVFVGVVNGTPAFAFVSNYETLEKSGHQPVAEPQFLVSVLEPQPLAENPVAVVITGDTGSFDPTALEQAKEKILRDIKGGVPALRIKNCCVKIIRDGSLGSRKTGSIGSSALWGIIEIETGRSEEGLDVIGGTDVSELPNLITPVFSIKDAFVATGDFEGLRRRELRCPNCRQLAPVGFHKCPACCAPLPQPWRAQD